MPFDHNDHYHRLLLRHVPQNCRTALDVGCGTGRFARRLAERGVDVAAIDPSEEVIAAARALSGQPAADAAAGKGPRFECGDVTEAELPKGRYDFISCLASLHHMPFGTVVALRDALAPGGVLVILGCYPERTRTDWAWSLAAVPVNAAARLAVAARDALRPVDAAAAGRTGPAEATGLAEATGPGEVTGPTAIRMKAPVRQPTMPLDQIRREAAVLLPGCGIRRLLFWRYLLVFREGASAKAGT
jgi:SAM-dependent methyltransferase